MGDLVFAAVETAHKHTEPEITCITGSGKAEGLGPLKDGHMIHSDLATCRRYDMLAYVLLELFTFINQCVPSFFFCMFIHQGLAM